MITPQKIVRPRAVLFDYDGVLVASEPIHLLAWMQLLAELNLPQEKELILSSVGKTAPEILTRLLTQYKPNWREEGYDVHELARRKNVFYLEYAKSGLGLYPGVLDGVQWLRSQKIATAIVSNGKHREIDHTMKLLGLDGLMDLVLSREDVPNPKPHPLPYLTAAATLGFEPHECIAIEDSPTGLEAALMARIPTAAVLTNFSKLEVQTPVPGRPDLSPIWIGASIIDFFSWIQRLPV